MIPQENITEKPKPKFLGLTLNKWASVATIIGLLVTIAAIWISNNAGDSTTVNSGTQVTQGSGITNTSYSNSPNSNNNNTTNSGNGTMTVTNSGTMGDVVNGDKTTTENE